MNRMKDKVSIVTGGSLGIGKASCSLLAMEGAKVAITDLREKEGQELASDIKNKGGEVEYWYLDVTDENNVKSVFEKVNEKFGKINVLVNNAGISGVNKNTDEITEKEWDRVINVNLKGVFFCTKHVIPYMKANGGSIINLSSIYGIIGAPDVPPYHASKGAVRIMTKTDALLYAKHSIRVNSVHPAYIWTPMVADMARQSTKDIEQYKKQLGDLHPIGHVGEPEDVAYGIIYLASDESKFVTGSELLIDGGYTAR